jgi:xanthine dehydrogenase/oxidase
MPDKPMNGKPEPSTTVGAEEYARDLVFFINNERVEIANPDPAVLLVDYLRSPEVGLTGTKKSCGQGGCGACTVMLSSYDAETGAVINRSVNSCLRPVCSLDGMAITTIEGLGSVKPEVSPEGISPVQYRIAKCNGSQCGYCTPGFVMNMHSFLVANGEAKTTKAQIENLFDGSICRCTGFRPILYAMKSFASDWTKEDEAGTPECYVDPAESVPHHDEIKSEFPPALKRAARPVRYERDGHLWYRPLTLAAAHELMSRHRDTAKVKLVGGNTEVGIPGVLPVDPHVFIDISHIAELKGCARADGRLSVGASVTYSEFLDFVEAQVADAPPEQRVALEALQYMARRTAGTIVRNAASLAGNTMLVVRNAVRGTPFPSDLFTVLACLGAELSVSTGADSINLPILDLVERYHTDADFRRTAIITAYHIPLTTKDEYARAYKVALRQENAHSVVNACFKVRLGADAAVADASLVLGGIAPVAFHASKTEKALRGKQWNEATLTAALKAIVSDVNDAYKASRTRLKALPFDGIPEKYRRQLAESFFYKFFIYVAEQTKPGDVPPRDRTAGELFERPVSRGTQDYEVYPDEYPVSRPIIKLSAFEQATGEARYTHDLSLPPRGLYAAFVTSLRAVADFHYVIPQQTADAPPVDVPTLLRHVSEKFAGVVDYITYLDIPAAGANMQGAGDDPLFCEGQVTCWGQSIGLVVAKEEQTAIDAAAYIQQQCIVYTPTKDKDGNVLEPVITIGDAIKQNSFFKPPSYDDLNMVERPGSDLGWTGGGEQVVLDGMQCAVVKDTQHTGSQAHFYMETQSCLAQPDEGNALTIYPSSQSPASIQGSVAQTLGLQFNNVDVNIKRLGGAYGGKTTRSPFVASPVALAAWKLNRAVKIAMPRDIDMAMIGKRHAFRGDYQIAIVAEDGDRKGEILGSMMRFYSNAGNTIDCSFDVMDCAVAGSDGAYMIKNFKTKGTVCKTNIASNGAMRSYGGIQAALIQEDAIAAAAHRVGLLPEDVRERNLYRRTDTTPYGQSLEYEYLKDVWDRLKQTSDFDARLQGVREFNARNRWRKRGISMMPLKYGLGYNLGYLQQGSALITAYTTDGSVLVHHGGVEMGQGMMTKMAQVAAGALNVPLGLVQMTAMDTNITPNATGTGATSSSDINGGAIQQAADELRERLEAFCHQCQEWFGVQWCIDNGINYWDYAEGWQAEVTTKGATGKSMMWLNVLAQAYKYRIDLSAQALYKTPGLGDIQDKQFYDYTYSAGCSEVEIDVLTGETTILRSDLCYDMGKSMNPAIDIGQIEGAFVMGIGNVLSEELVFQPDGEQRGALNTTNTWTYKPPAHTSIPIDLRVEIFPRSAASEVRENPNLLLSSKGVGEPPLVLAASVHGAVKQAVLAARKDRGRDDWFQLRSPATVERVREACIVETADLNLNS